jgi:hypothetical protein
VISTTTDFNRAFSASSRCSRADGLPLDPLSKTFDAEPNSCRFQP